MGDLYNRMCVLTRELAIVVTSTGEATGDEEKIRETRIVIPDRVFDQISRQMQQVTWEWPPRSHYGPGTTDMAINGINIIRRSEAEARGR